MTLEQGRIANERGQEPDKNPGIIRVPTGIIEHKPEVVVRLQDLFSTLLSRKDQEEQPPASSWLEQSFETQIEVVKFIDPDVVTFKGSTYQYQTLPAGTRVVVAVDYAEIYQPVLLLGGLILDSDTTVKLVGSPDDSWRDNYNVPAPRDGTPIARRMQITDENHSPLNSEEIKQFSNKFQEFLDQGEATLDLDKITRLYLIAKVRELPDGDGVFDNYAEYSKWFQVEMAKAWDKAKTLRKKLEATGKLKKIEEGGSYFTTEVPIIGSTDRTFLRVDYARDRCKIKIIEYDSEDHEESHYGEEYVLIKDRELSSGSSRISLNGTESMYIPQEGRQDPYKFVDLQLVKSYVFNWWSRDRELTDFDDFFAAYNKVAEIVDSSKRK